MYLLMVFLQYSFGGKLILSCFLHMFGQEGDGMVSGDGISGKIMLLLFDN